MALPAWPLIATMVLRRRWRRSLRLASRLRPASWTAGPVALGIGLRVIGLRVSGLWIIRLLIHHRPFHAVSITRSGAAKAVTG